MQHYVYLHKRKDNGIVFYVGKSHHYKKGKKHARAYNKSDRHEAWLKYTANIEYEVCIYGEYEDSNTAFLVETELMKQYGFLHDNTGTLVNQVYSTIKTYQYDADGNFIAEFNSFREAFRTTKTNLSDLQDAFYGRLNGANNFQWKSYKADKIEPLARCKRIKAMFIILQMDDNFNILKEWISIAEIVRVLGISKAKVYRSYRDKNVSINGFKFIKKDNYGSLHL